MATQVHEYIKRTNSPLHFPQLSATTQTCGKRIHPRGNRGAEVVCGQDKDGARHLFYGCEVDRFCPDRFLSIDMRLEHEERRHGR
jgi:hypothetical protein